MPVLIGWITHPTDVETRKVIYRKQHWGVTVLTYTERTQLIDSHKDDKLLPNLRGCYFNNITKITHGNIVIYTSTLCGTCVTTASEYISKQPGIYTTRTRNNWHTPKHVGCHSSEKYQQLREDETAVGCSGRLSVCCVGYCLPSKLLRQCGLLYSYQVALPLKRNLEAQLVILWLLSHLHHSAKWRRLLSASNGSSSHCRMQSPAYV